MNEKLEFYEIVKVLPSGTTNQFAIVGMEGIVLGISQAQNATYYAVLIDDQTYSLEEDDLEGTGRVISRDHVYPGDVLTVSQAGEVIRFKAKEDG